MDEAEETFRCFVRARLPALKRPPGCSRVMFTLPNSSRWKCHLRLSICCGRPTVQNSRGAVGACTAARAGTAS